MSSFRLVSLGSVLVAALLAACGGATVSPIGGGSSSGGSGSGSGSGGSSSGGSSSGGSSGGSSSGGSSSGGGSSSSGSGSGSSSGGGSGGCPTSAPASGGACTGTLSCEYGGDPDVECDTLAVCVNGAWSVTDSPTDGLCPTSPPGKNGCPGSYSDVPVGQGCSGVTECDYPQGRCGCTLQQGGPAQFPDAGAQWVCEQPTKGCPEPRPQAGTACDSSGVNECDYGSCALPGGVLMVCTNGTWGVEYTACAEAADGRRW